ncbi:MAG TPA: hypothetical protein VEI97_12345 [bacterium]|nr:hypothetical protein [bacterium]
MTAPPPVPPLRRLPLPYRLQTVLLSTLALAVVFAPVWYQRSAPEAVGWLAGAGWMAANLNALDRLIRSAIAPPDQVDKGRAVQAGLLVVLILPVMLLGLLFWAQSQGALIAVAAGITLPLAVLLLRALSGVFRK